MPASQHQKPKSDIDIAQAATMRPIMELAKDRLGIDAKNLEPYGHYKAKVSMDYVKSLENKPNGKLILVTAITPTPAGEGKTTTTVGLTDALNFIGKKAMLCLREAVARSLLRRQRRRCRRRLRAGRADGRHQSAFHRRFPRHHLGAQSFVGADRQPHLLGQCARHRLAPRRLAPRHGHERPRAARDRRFARRRRQRLSARGRLRHHGRFRSHGDLLSGQESRRSARAARQHHRRLYARAQTRARQGAQRQWRHGGAVEGCDRAQSGADAGRHARLHSRRPLRQYRAWLQHGLGDHHRAQARRLCGDRSRLRRRSGRREIPRHQVPQGGPGARLRGDRRHHPRAQDAWRRQEGRPQEGRPQGARSRHGQSCSAMSRTSRSSACRR